MIKFKSLLSILILLQISLHLTFAQQDSFAALLPKSGECGQLNTTHLYNEESLTAPTEFPWIARVKLQGVGSQQRYWCSATLISKRHLLSVAHCYANVKRTEPVSVVLGDWNTSNSISERDCNAAGVCAPAPPQEYEIDEVILNPEFLDSSDNDLAVLRLARDVVFAPHIQPICLPSFAVRNDDYVAQYLPYGGFHKELPDKSKLLAHVISLKRCTELYNRKFSNNYICGTCTRRVVMLTGTPLMGVSLENAEPRSFYLMGLLSLGSLFCSTDKPDVFVNIWHNLDWIKTNVY